MSKHGEWKINGKTVHWSKGWTAAAFFAVLFAIMITVTFLRFFIIVGSLAVPAIIYRAVSGKWPSWLEFKRTYEEHVE